MASEHSNPLRRWYAELRYATGNRALHWLSAGGRAERFPRLNTWAIDTESRCTRLWDPWVDRACRLDEQRHKLWERSWALQARASRRRGLWRFVTTLRAEYLAGRAWGVGEARAAHHAIRYPEDVGAWEALVGPTRPRT